jgi:hypothetical protein
MTTSFANIVNRYLSSEIPYALLIDGKWGSGKTWYLKNKFEDDFSRKIIFTSANGITSMDDLTQQILYRKLYLSSNLVSDPKAKLAYSLVKEVGKSILNKYTGFNVDDFSTLNVNLNDFASISDNEVLIIDDIERMSGDLIEELLGFVSKNFTEENGFKVILVADEIKLTEKYGADEKKYLDIKEKTIWQTISFQLDYEKIIPSLTSKYLNSIHKFYPEFNQDVILFFKEHKISNLRTILYGFSCIGEVLHKVDEKKLLPGVVKSIFILTNEFKVGNIKSNIEFKAPEYIKTTIPTISWNLDNKEDLEPSETEMFSKTYLNESHIKYFYFESLYQLVCQGYLDDELLKNELGNYSRSLKSPNPALDAIQKIYQYRNLSDEKFDKTIELVLEYLDKGCYNISDFGNIIKYFGYFFEIEILNISKDEFEANLEKSISKISPNLEFRTLWLPKVEIKDFNYLKDGTKYYQLFQLKIKEIEENYFLNEKQEFIAALKKGDNLEQSLSFLFIYFNKKELDKIAEYYAKQSTSLQKLLDCFKISKHAINDLHEDGVKNFNYFISKLKEKLVGKKIALSIVNEIEKLKE